MGARFRRLTTGETLLLGVHPMLRLIVVQAERTLLWRF